MDLASYRELESFAQFGSDLDPSTKQKLERGKRTVEVLKQDLHESLTMEEEALILYGLINKHLDDIDVDQIKTFEKELFRYIKTDELGIRIANFIKTNKVLPDSQDLEELFKRFKRDLSF